MNADKQVLMIFVKEPIPGFVKTRLADSIGNEEACKIYQLFLEMISKNKLNGNWDTRVYYASDSKPVLLHKIFGDKVEYFAQSPGDLGMKMEEAFKECLPYYSKVVVIGGDSPDLPNEYIKYAFSLLDDSDVVIGPSSDGGYYLLGLKKVYTQLFHDINWGSDSVLTTTLNRISENSLKLSQLQNWEDVDTLSDLKIFLQNNPEFEFQVD